jgi:hypothetical protein
MEAQRRITFMLFRTASVRKSMINPRKYRSGHHRPRTVRRSAPSPTRQDSFAHESQLPICASPGNSRMRPDAFNSNASTRLVLLVSESRFRASWPALSSQSSSIFRQASPLRQ